jgi:hypothetical protein
MSKKNLKEKFNFNGEKYVSDYYDVGNIVKSLKVGDCEEFTPTSIQNSRKYICDYARVEKKKFTTRTEGGKLLVMRVI